MLIKKIVKIASILLAVALGGGGVAQAGDLDRSRHITKAIVETPLILAGGVVLGITALREGSERKTLAEAHKEAGGYARYVPGQDPPVNEILAGIKANPIMEEKIRQRADAPATLAVIQRMKPQIAEITSSSPDRGSVALLDHALDQFQAKLDLINTAEEGDQLYVSTYILGKPRGGGEDEVQWWAIEALSSAARRGVEVHFLVDKAGLQSYMSLKILLESGVHVHVFEMAFQIRHPLEFYKRMHDKLVILVDRDSSTGAVKAREMVLGSGNWRDGLDFFANPNPPNEREIYYRGPKVEAAVKHFIGIVNYRRTRTYVLDENGGLVWGRMADGLEKLSEKPIVFSNDEIKTAAGQHAKYMKRFEAWADLGYFQPPTFRLWMSENFTDDGKSVELVFDDIAKLGKEVSENSKKIAALIDEAQKSVIFENPYVLMSATIRGAIDRAIARNVKFTIYTNSKRTNDEAMASGGYIEFTREIARRGIQVYELCPRQNYPDPNHPCRKYAYNAHAKNFVIDDQIAVVGSYNLDPRSERMNSEVNVVVRNPEVAVRLRKMIEKQRDFGAEEIVDGKILGIEKRFTGKTFMDKIEHLARQKVSIWAWPQL